MEKQKAKKSSFRKVMLLLTAGVVALTFFSKSLYYRRLITVSAKQPISGKMVLQAEGNSSLDYPKKRSVYGEVDARIQEVCVREGESVQKGQCILRVSEDLTGEEKEILADQAGVVTMLGVEEGMHVFSTENRILYQIAEDTQYLEAVLFLTQEEYRYLDPEAPVRLQLGQTGEVKNAEIVSLSAYGEQGGICYTACVRVPAEDGRFWKSPVRWSVTCKSERYDTLLPAAALHQDYQGYYVLLLEWDDSALGMGYRAKRRSVELLDKDDTYCALLGVMDQELAIVGADREVTDGMRVYYEGAGE